MISSSSPQTAYVYITLPGHTAPITAGRLTVTTDRHAVAQGRFVYGKKYLARADAVAIDPVELKLGAVAYTTTAMHGIFGALRDASPDYWGRRVIEHHCGKPHLSGIDYLLYSPDDRAGALGFGLNPMPPAPKRDFNRTIDLASLQQIADAIVRDEPVPNVATGQIADLMLIGTSMGGARPKAVVADDAGLWIAKFNRGDDKWNQAVVEHAMLLLARSCGITTAESKVISIAGRDVLLVKRFDRRLVESGYERARMISALTLLRADDTISSRDKWSYIALVEELRRASAEPARDAAELFRRMCFNALISNTDDHPRNHALLADGKDWRLSPAYDLTPAPLIASDRRDLGLAPE